jgi:tRNA1Val (adenine37-N6)-methyltransferase
MSQTTVDALYDGQLQLKQSKSGYRFGVDAVVLATFAGSGLERTLDLGTGVGVVALSLWKERKSERITAVDVQHSLCRLAHANVVLNDAEEHIQIVEGDLRDGDFVKSLGVFDRVIMNPPYWPVNAGRLPPNEEKAIAKHKLLGGLDEWLKAAAYALRAGGVLEVVYPCERLPGLMARAVHFKLNPSDMTIVHTRPKSAPAFVLLRCEKQGRSGLRVTAPWLIYGSNGKPHSRYGALVKARPEPQ